MAIDERVVVSTPEGLELSLAPAGPGSRFIASLLDGVIQGLVILAVGFLVVQVFSLALENDNATIAILALTVFGVIVTYDLAFETLADGQTPGKRAAGLRVVTIEGAPVGFLASVVRNFLRIVDFLPSFYLAGIVTIVATPRNQRLGDLAAGTLVVRERREPDNLAAARALVSRPTVAPDAVALWDVTGLTDADLRVVHRFLDRRLALPGPVRWQLSVDLATRLAPRVPGIPAGAHPEYVLEGIAVAAGRRTSKS